MAVGRGHACLQASGAWWLRQSGRRLPGCASSRAEQPPWAQADAVFMSTGSGDSMDASMMGSVMASVDESGSGPVTASP